MNEAIIPYSLRGYQQKTLDQIREYFLAGKRKVIVQLPTGAGKGLIMSHIVNAYLSKGKKVLTVLKGKDLLEQTRKNYLKYHQIESGIIQGKRKDFNSKSIIASIDTLARQENLNFNDIDLCIVDEAHNTTTNSYSKLFKSLSSSNYAIGFTATPYATGNKYLPFWDSFVRGATYDELVKQNFLVKYQYYAPKGSINTKGIRTLGSDYDQKELFNRAQDNKIIGDVVETYKKLGQNKNAFLFAINIEHSKIMAKAFNDAGIPAVHCDGDTPSEEREVALTGLREGKIKILCNVDIFSTGIDVPEASVLISVRPTKSLILWQQQAGRVLRPAEGKDKAIYLDHSGNYTRHGLVGAVFEPELVYLKPKGQKKKPEKLNTTPLKLCPDCQSVIAYRKAACDCGYEFTAISNDLEKRFLDGELAEIEPESFDVSGIKQHRVMIEHFRQKRNFKPNWTWYRLAEKYPVHVLRKIFPSFPEWITGKRS